MESRKVYFPNLNGLRFIAAAVVIVHHIEQLKFMSNLPNYWRSIAVVGLVGKLGVVLFFVLSGFLITYLLLVEEEAYSTIAVKKFYMRRVLRIWPLYFLLIVLAFVVIPYVGFLKLPGLGRETVYKHVALKGALYVVFLPNLALSMNSYLGLLPYAYQTWSIGTEEQFYLMWPVLMKHVKKLRIPLMFAIVGIYLIVEEFLSSRFADSVPSRSVVKEFWESFNIDCMAIGGVYAILLFRKDRLMQLLLNRYAFFVILFSTGAIILRGTVVPHANNEFYAVLFGFLILNFAANPRIGISLEYRILNYLGNISYGLYMYHLIGIGIALAIARGLNLEANWFIYPVSFAITITLAGVSYKYFESYFLKFKSKFSKIHSGSQVAS